MSGIGGTGGSGTGGIASDAEIPAGYTFDSLLSAEGGSQVRAGRGGVEARVVSFPRSMTYGFGYRVQYQVDASNDDIFRIPVHHEILLEASEQHDSIV